MPLKLVKGDLLESKDEYIAHQTNCISCIPHGLSMNISRKFPSASIYEKRTKQTNNIATENTRDIPGTIKITQETNESVKVIHMFAQYSFGKPFSTYNKDKKFPEDTYEQREKWFNLCLQKIEELKPASIGFPYKIGCGLAGGNWDVYLKNLDKRNESFKRNSEVNPFTGIKLKKDGSTWKQINQLFLLFEAYKRTKSPGSPDSPLDFKDCDSTYDPITLEDFSPTDNIVKLSKGLNGKYRCRNVDSMIGVIEAATAANKPIIDPQTNLKLSENDIQKIVKAKRKVDKFYVLKKPKKINLRGLKLSLEDDMFQFNDTGEIINLTEVLVKDKNNKVIFNLGFFPSDIEPEDTGSVDYSTAVLKVSLHKLWEEQRFLTDFGYSNLEAKNMNKLECCNIHLRKNEQYWRDDKIKKFKNMVDEVMRFL